MWEKEKTKLSIWREMCMNWQKCCEEGKKKTKNDQGEVEASILMSNLFPPSIKRNNLK